LIAPHLENEDHIYDRKREKIKYFCEKPKKNETSLNQEEHRKNTNGYRTSFLGTIYESKKKKENRQDPTDF
jgi:predicted adenine nucleotide alpha hydrolase (AANH) superfamily ATPase